MDILHLTLISCNERPQTISSCDDFGPTTMHPAVVTYSGHLHACHTLTPHSSLAVQVEGQ